MPQGDVTETINHTLPEKPQETLSIHREDRVAPHTESLVVEAVEGNWPVEKPAVVDVRILLAVSGGPTMMKVIIHGHLVPFSFLA